MSQKHEQQVNIGATGLMTFAETNMEIYKK